MNALYRFSICFIALISVLFSGLLSAHEIRPAYISLLEQQPQTYTLLWKLPVKNGAAPDLELRFPDHCQAEFSPIPAITPDAIVRQGSLTCLDAGLAAGRISIEKLETTLLDVLVRVQWLNGEQQQRLIQRDTPYWQLNSHASPPTHVYLTLGFEHILGGIDHLLFLLALMLIVSGKIALIKTVTAFTLAHSITLVLSTLGFIHLPSAPVEASIALSVGLISAEAIYLRRGKTTLASSQPWLMAFLFGLLHGLGFAGALSEVGLPPTDIPLALTLFNLGIETGQLLFIFVVLALVHGIKRLIAIQANTLIHCAAYGIGCVAVFWTFERVALMIQ